MKWKVFSIPGNGPHSAPYVTNDVVDLARDLGYIWLRSVTDTIMFVTTTDGMGTFTVSFDDWNAAEKYFKNLD